MKLFKSTYKTSSDEDLMRMVITGDAYAFEMIYDRYSKAMLAYFYKMLWQDREKAEDFMQDLFAKIVQKPDSFDPKRTFKTWLYSVAHNMCKNEYRKQEVRKDTRNTIDDGMQVSDGNYDSQAKQLHIKDFNSALDSALGELEEKHRTVFIMRFKMNLSIKEIADSLEISDGTVKSRIFYCVKKLSTQLEEYNPLKQEEVYHG